MADPSTFPVTAERQGTAPRLARGHPIDPARQKKAARPPGPVRSRIPLSPAQESIWFFSEYDRTSPVYNLPLALRLTGALDMAALQQSLDAIVARHETLRTRFVAESGVGVQQVDPPAPVRMPLVDLGDCPERLREGILRRRLDSECRRPFDLTRQHPFRVRLFRLGPTEHVLSLTKHHIAVDGWSEVIFLREWTALYDGFRNRRPAALAPLPVSYTDYCSRQRAGFDPIATSEALAYWRGALDGAPSALELPTDNHRPASQSFHGMWQRGKLPGRTMASLQDLSRAERSTLFMTVLAGFAVLLGRCGGGSDIVIATPVAGRDSSDVEGLIGCLLNTMAVRIRLEGDPAFLQVVRQVRSSVLEGLAHASLPFEKVVQELKPARNANSLPLAQVMFVFQGSPSRFPQPAGLAVAPVETDTGTSKMDMTLYLNACDGVWTTAIEYRSDLFRPETVSRLLGHFGTLLDGIAADPGRRISELPLLTSAQRREVLSAWNETEVVLEENVTLAEEFERQHERTPAAIAVTIGDRSLTYRELHRIADGIAGGLRAHGAGPRVAVGLGTGRSLGMLAGMLGILKCGAAYVPLDPSLPAERLAHMMEDSGLALLLTEPGAAGKFAGFGGATLVVGADGELGEVRGKQEIRQLDPPADGSDPAYVLYTSGSTGHPKGVLVTQRNVRNLFVAMDQALETEAGVWLAVTRVSFDISVVELLWTLARGFTVVIATEDDSPGAAGDEAILDLIRRHGITHLQCTPSLARMIAGLPHAREAMASLRQWLVGGEAVPAAVVRELHALFGGELFSFYGPTETTVWSSVYRVPRLGCADPAPLGRPLANTQLYLLDENRQPVPLGSRGEIHIGGFGVAHGYLNLPELTASRFFSDPFRTGGRIYRTGDLGRRTLEGEIRFLGRADHQVKLRGHRIELGEIESAMRQHPAVRDCVAVAWDGGEGDIRLAAYAVLADGDGTADIRAFLRDRIPDYMLPSAILRLPALPLTPNGKIDRAALPHPAGESERGGGVAPRTELEKRLAHAWAEVLGIRAVGVADNFFELGGHSLLAVRLAARIGQDMGRKFPLSLLYEAPTIEQLARRLEPSAEAAPPSRELVAIQPRGALEPLFLVHGIASGMLWGYNNLSKHLGPRQPVYAFKSRAVDGGTEFATIEEMAAHYITVLRSFRPQGPYLLGGYCFGGNVAFEMARQLAAAGSEVPLVILLNSFPPNSGFRGPPRSLQEAGQFILNLGRIGIDFFRRTPVDRMRILQWRGRTIRRRLTGWLNGTVHDARLDDVADLRSFPPEQRHLLEAHAAALWEYRNGPYDGRVTLLRTPTYPVLCRFDPDFCWGKFAMGGVDVRILEGTHDGLLDEPCVGRVALELAGALAAARRGMTRG